MALIPRGTIITHLVKSCYNTLVKQIKKKILSIPLILIWLSHLIQVFVPETGFDALWYHLPIAKAIIKNKGLVYLPNLYQSLNPLFADLYFTFGYFLLGDLGAKIVAYLFALSLIFVTYKLSRKYLNKSWSILAITLISTFQVISWQSASFYVDLAKAFFEISALLLLYCFLFDGSHIIENKNKENSKHLVIAGLFFGASLASKLFSLFLLPVYLLIIYLFSQKNKIKNTTYFLFSSLLLPFPFYLFAYLNTGNPFYSFLIHFNKLGEIGGNNNLLFYFLERTIKLPFSLFEIFSARDYISFIFLIFLPIVLLSYKKILNRKNIFLLIFSLSQYLLWWYLPPLSSRYAMAGFITLTIFYLKIIHDFTTLHKEYLKPIIIGIIFSILINFAPRIIVNIRSLKYILGKQTKLEYLEQFYDGSIDNNIKEWHFRTTL